MWQALLGLIPSLIGTAMDAGRSGSTTAKTPPPPPKPEFQPLQRAPSASRQPMNFDPGAGQSGIDPNDTRLQAIASLRGKLGL